jgi:hypothetical protein
MSIIRKAILIMLLTMALTLVFAQNEKTGKEKTMTKEEMLDLHKQMGIAYFNKSWDLLTKPDRTKADEDVLINTVNASLYHWRQVGDPIAVLRGEWLIAHVYTLIKHKEEALYHAQNTLDLAIELKATDWDMAYAYEAMARAYAVNGNKELFNTYYEKAFAAGKNIKEDDDIKQFDTDMNDQNWFGMK